MADLMELARAAATSIRQEETEEETYTLVDLSEMDRLLHELARREGWTDADLAEKLDQRRRMAPVNVPAALAMLRAGVKAASGQEKPARRVPVVLCLISGGKK